MESQNNILVIEDDALLAANIELSLTKQGLIVVGIATNLKEAVDIIKRNPVDLALIDIQLNGPEDGIVTAAELLRIKWIPIIYMTGNTPLEVEERLKKTYPAAFLEKPLSMNELVVQVKLALLNFNAGNLPAPQPSLSEYLFLPADKGHISVRVKEILYIKANGGYSRLFVSKTAYSEIYPSDIYPQKSYDPILISANMGRIFRRLSSDFYLLSRSMVINLSHISRIEANRLFITNEEIAIPEGRRKDLMTRLSVVTN